MSVSPPGELSDRVAVVSGSSRGIGLAIAQELAAAGANIVVHGGHDSPALLRAREAICSHGVEVEAVVADLSDQGGQKGLLDHAWSWKGHVDIWVNNAGVDILTGERRGWTYERKLEALWNVDVRGTIRLSREIGKRMFERGSGVIVNTGWDGAERGMAGDTAELFAASKGAVMAFTRSLAQSLAPRVRVNCMALGWIKTSWGEQAPEAWQERAKQESLAGRWGTPEDVARVARFLASPQSAFLSGQVIQVNGGFKSSPETS